VRHAGFGCFFHCAWAKTLVSVHPTLQCPGTFFIHTLTTVCLQEFRWVIVWKTHQRAHWSVPNRPHLPCGFCRKSRWERCLYPFLVARSIRNVRLHQKSCWVRPPDVNIRQVSSWNAHIFWFVLVPSLSPSGTHTFSASPSPLFSLTFSGLSEHWWFPHSLPFRWHHCC
jgi:hypothetical protein